MSKSLPVIFLAFANEYHEGRHLDGIGGEMTELDPILAPISNLNPDKKVEPLCELVIKPKVTLGQILEVFRDYQDRDMIFHYSGHADGFQLLLEGKDGTNQTARGEGLVPIISRRRNIKLVFLNGCSTQRLARELVRNGTMAVIGTSASIADSLAKTLSVTFYQGLAKGLTIAGAWEDAKATVLAGDNEVTQSVRGIKLYSEADRFPWDVEFRDDAAKEVFDNWNLPEEANNPLINLPELPEADLPADSPFMFLKPYEAEHAEIFFGRSYYIRDLWLKILEKSSPPLILLYGESGAGKSSLLDAGLVPRLRAAGLKDDYPQFEVRYQRRDQREGLVESLARLLEFTPGRSRDEAAPAEADSTDPAEAEARRRELERLEQIESMARELQEERTTYTLLSIVERYRRVQAAPQQEQAPTGIYKDDGDLMQDAGQELRKAWRAWEEKTGKRLVIMLDQVEELFTDPHEQHKNELDDLLGVLKEIFSRRSGPDKDRIRGKLILGYREEFNAKIEARVKDKELSRATVFLEQLNRRDIHDIFNGLQRGRAKQEYNIRIDPELPDRVANYLLNGRAAVAPVLQLLLTKLWKYAYAKNSGQPHFSVEAFQAVSSQGQEMEEYFDTQMLRIRQWDAEAVDSGLALDLLHFHVSERGTSAARHIDAIRQRYRHLPEEFDLPADYILNLVREMRKPDVFLLNSQGQHHTTLPHDTLAPVIVAKYNQSDKFGQRSARIMDTKAQELARVAEEEETRLRLDENDLEVVKLGKKGMRALNEREQELLQRSLDEQEKRLRLRRLLIKGGIAAGLFILVLSILAGSLSFSMVEQIKNAAAVRAHEAGLLRVERSKKDFDLVDTLIRLSGFAYENNNPKRLDVVKSLYDLYDQYGLPALADDTGNAAATGLIIDLQPSSRISSLDYVPTLGLLASFEDTTIIYREEAGANTDTINLSPYLSNNIRALEVGFSADRRQIQVLSRYNRAPYYLLGNEMINPPHVIKNIYAPPAADSYVQTYMNFVGYYDFLSGQFTDYSGVNISREDLSYQYPYLAAYEYDDQGQLLDSAFIDVDTLFSFKLWDEDRNLLNRKDYDRLLEKPWGRFFSGLQLMVEGETGVVPIRRTNLSWGTYNGMMTWDLEALKADRNIAPNLFYQEAPLLFLSALGDNTFLTVDPFRQLEIRISDENNWFGEAQSLDTLLPANEVLIDLAISPNQNHLVVLTSEDSVLVWDFAYLDRRSVSFRHAELKQYAFSPDGNQLMTLSADSVCVWSAREDRTYTFKRPEGLPPIAFARFRPGEKENENILIVGMTNPVPAKKGKESGLWTLLGDLWGQLKFWEDAATPRIAVWDIGQRSAPRIYKTGEAVLLDATLSRDHAFAVALHPEEATIIEMDNDRIGDLDAFADDISAGKKSKMSISPAGDYIVRRSEQERRLELFAPNGRPLNAYYYQDGFNQGFQGQLFTSNDQFLIAHKRDEILLWNPLDAAVGDWIKPYELSLTLKRNYGVDTFLDYIPGSTRDAKWSAIFTMLAALIFLFWYFSEFVIRFVQSRSYVELALYFAGFMLFAVMLTVSWKIGAQADEFKRSVFYLLIFTALGAAIAGIRRYWDQIRKGDRKKFASLATVIAIASAILVGSFVFFRYEAGHLQQEFDFAAGEFGKRKEVSRQNYQRLKQLYQEWYPEFAGADELDEQQLQSLTYYEYGLTAPERSREWPNVLIGLLLLLLFLFLVGYPIYRSIAVFRLEGRTNAAFYNWLYLPASCLSLTIWIAYGAADVDNAEYAVGELLNQLSVIVLAIIAIRQSRLYLQSRQYGLLLVYAVLTTLIGFTLYVESGLFALALGAAYILGRQYRGQGAHGKSFLAFSAAILVGIGGLFWAALNEFEGLIAAGILGAGLLVLLFWGVRRAIQRRAAALAKEAQGVQTRGERVLFVSGIVVTLLLFGISAVPEADDVRLALLVAGGFPLLLITLWSIPPQRARLAARTENGSSTGSNRLLLYGSYGLIYLVASVLLISLSEEGEPILIGILIAALLVLLYYGIRQQLQRMKKRKAAGKSRWGNRLAVLALGFLAFSFSEYYALELFDYSYDDYAAYGDDYYYPEPEYEQTGQVSDDFSDGESDVLPEAMEGADTAPENGQEAISSPENFDQLIDDLFVIDQTTQDNAMDRLITSYRGHPGLLNVLFEAHDQHPEASNRTGNVLFLLENQSNEYLRENSDEVFFFLDQVQNEDNFDRIEALRERVLF